MNNPHSANEQLVLDFVEMLQRARSAADLERFYHPETEQTEYPNAVTKNTAFRSLDDLKMASERGKSLMQKEELEVRNLYSYGDTVILEAIWTGTLAIPVGNIPAGGQIKAYFAQFFEIREGKIFRQRNYDCFEPF